MFPLYKDARIIIKIHYKILIISYIIYSFQVSCIKHASSGPECVEGWTLLSKFILPVYADIYTGVREQFKTTKYASAGDKKERWWTEQTENVLKL